jgi:hypothetical protein
MLTNMLNVARDPFNRGTELIIRGKKDGRPRSWLLRRQPNFAFDFLSDRHGEIAATLAEVIAPAAPGNEFTAMLVPENSGVRIGLDRDDDGFFDTTEIDSGSNPADPTSYPIRIVSISRSGNTVTLTWESVPGTNYVVQWTANLTAGTIWSNLGAPIVATAEITIHTDSPPASELRRFYRVRTEP